jgi:hypothetical protein
MLKKDLGLKLSNKQFVNNARLVGETEWAKIGRSTGTTEIELNLIGAA